MSWVHVSDTYPTDPIWQQAGGSEMFHLHIAAMAWCSQHQTDGAISDDVARRLLSLRRPGPVIRRLLTAGLWQEVSDLGDENGDENGDGIRYRMVSYSGGDDC